jgi:PhoD-like phosphatase
MKTARGLSFLCTFLLLLGIASTSVGAVSYMGDIGTATTKTSGTSLSVSTNQAVAAGDTIIVAYVTDPAQNLVVNVSDDAGNTYEQAALAVNWSNGRAYIFAAYDVTALPNHSSITISCDQSVAAKAAVVSVFRGLAQVNVLDQFLGNPRIEDQTTQSGTTPSVGPTGTTTQANELLIGVIGTNGPVEDTAGTWNNSFTAGSRVGTTGGSAADNWTVSMGYRIVSATGTYTAQKSGITSRNWAAAIATFKTGNTLESSSYDILLGRPTDHSIALNVIPNFSGYISFEYGTSPGSYGSPTGSVACTAGAPVDAVIDGLSPDMKYYYRLRYSSAGADPWAVGNEYSFHTQRAKGETFTFTVTSDSHLGETFSSNSSDRYRQTTLNVASDNPDFGLDLGDAFVMSSANNQTDANNVYLAQRPYFGNYSHSAPVFLAIGNHENEEGWNLDDTPFSQGLGSMIARKMFFLNPIPNAFYSGNQDLLPAVEVSGDQHREDYYAWTWGDALFIVLDPFQYTMAKPYGDIAGSGEGTDDPQSGDQWNWTLGKAQYDWLYQTLENSNAKFKFVFSHHVLGGQLDVSGAAGTPGYVRGGAMAVPYFEWGGENADGSWGFDTKRPGWAMPIHQLMVTYHVSAFFHGHDHQFVHEVRDGIVYQLVPAAGMTGNGFDLYTSSPYVVSGGNLPNAGHVRVRVNYPSPNLATVDYVRSAISGDSGVTNGQVSHTYTIEAAPVSACQGDIEPGGGDGDVDGSDLAVYLGGSTGISLEDFAANFGRTDCSS